MDKVLVIDDHDDIRNTLSAALRDEDYHVETASNPEEALKMFIRSWFDFAIVDVRLLGGNDEDISGLTLAMALKQLRPETGIVILTRYEPSDITNRAVRYFGALKFISKTSDVDQETIRVLRDARNKTDKHSRIDQKDPETFFSISIHDKTPINVRSKGHYVYSGISETEFHINKKYSRRANSLLQNQTDWRALANDLGNDLWNEIFVGCNEVMSTYSEARVKSQRFSMSFETSRDGLGIPLEFVRLRNPEEYLVLRHPIARLITGISPRREAISPELLALTESLNILIIGSNTVPSIPGVDEEVRSLYQYLNSREIRDFIPVHVDLIPTERASFENICEALSMSKYDIIHYAGHGTYDEQSPEDSCLFFWNENYKKGSIRRMTTIDLTDLLRTSKTRLLYLSCCFGTTSALDANPNDDFLGLADSAIQAGVPSVVGFRAPVSDYGAIELAKSFYKHLFERGRLDISLWEARRELARINKDDPAWLSPILISQA